MQLWNLHKGKLDKGEKKKRIVRDSEVFQHLKKKKSTKTILVIILEGKRQLLQELNPEVYIASFFYMQKIWSQIVVC